MKFSRYSRPTRDFSGNGEAAEVQRGNQDERAGGRGEERRAVFADSNAVFEIDILIY